MRERNQETGLRYARLDGTIVNNDPPDSQYRWPSWRAAWAYCLKNFDTQAAALILARNSVSDDCEGGAHDDCHFLWCKCPHHSVVQFELEKPFKSLHELESEREAEMELV